MRNSTNGAASNLTSDSHQRIVIAINTGHSIITHAIRFGTGNPNLGLNRYPYPASTKNRAINNIVKDGVTNVTKEIFESYLYTCGQPPLDYIIRTSGEHRLSNFMLWQLAYAELYFPKVYWPGFNSKHLKTALLEFQSRDRRFGAIKE